MSLSVLTLPDGSVARASDSLLDNIATISTEPTGASSAAKRAFATLALVVTDARASKARHAEALATLREASAQFDQKLEAAQAIEKRADAAFALLRAQVALGVKARVPGSPELDAYLFPAGSTPVTALYGRSQVAEYQTWLPLTDRPTARSNPAYGLIAAGVEEFRDLLAAFTLAIQEKEAADTVRAAARTARNQVRGEWNGIFTELIAAAATVHGKESDLFLAWIKPLVRIHAEIAASSTRSATAADPADPEPVDPAVEGAVTEEGSG